MGDAEKSASLVIFLKHMLGLNLGARHHHTPRTTPRGKHWSLLGSSRQLGCTQFINDGRLMSMN